MDSFSPKTQKESNSLIKAIKEFKADLVIVLDNDKKLELKIRNEFPQTNEPGKKETFVYIM